MYRCASNLSRLVNYDDSDSDSSDSDNSYDEDDDCDDIPECSSNPGKFMRWKQLVRRLSSVILSQEHDRMELIDVDLAVDQIRKSCAKLQAHPPNVKQLKEKLAERLELLMKHENVTISQKKILNDCEEILKNLNEDSKDNEQCRDGGHELTVGYKKGNMKKHILPG